MSKAAVPSEKVAAPPEKMERSISRAKRLIGKFPGPVDPADWTGDGERSLGAA